MKGGANDLTCRKDDRRRFSDHCDQFRLPALTYVDHVTS